MEGKSNDKLNRRTVFSVPKGMDKEALNNFGPQLDTLVRTWGKKRQRGNSTYNRTDTSVQMWRGFFDGKALFMKHCEASYCANFPIGRAINESSHRYII